MTTPYNLRRQTVVDTLRRCGYPELADQALRDLPDPVDIDQVQAWGMQHGLTTYDQLISRIGGSP